MTSQAVPETVDVAVIGAGPGGYAAAFKATELGLDVALINDEPRLGGVCLNRGCIPSKTLLELSELSHAAQAAAAKGMTFGEPSIELDAVRDWKSRVVRELTDGLAELCKQRGVRVVQGQARFAETAELAVDGEQSGRCRFAHAILATGARPTPLPGADFSDGGRIMSSAGALELADVPGDLLVIGGGYIGMELGMVYASLGSRVTLVEGADRLMPEADADLCKPLARTAEQHFEAIHLGTTVTALDEQKDHVTATLGDGDDATSQRFQRVLVAIGRQPNTEALGLDAAGITLDDHGFVAVDAERRTSNERVHAIGDVAGGMMLAHEAMMEGKVAARAIAGENARFDARAIPAVAYTDPQIAWCGLTESEAESRDPAPRIERYPWAASGRAASMGATAGMTKLVLDPESGRVLGVGIVGPQAEALIAEGVLAMEMGAVAEDLAGIIHPHPTLTETLGESAELVFGQATHYG